MPSAYLLLYTLKGFKHAHACSTHIIHCEIKMHNHTGNLLRKKIYVKIPIYSNSILPIFILRHNRAWPRITYNNYRRCNYPDVIARRAEKFNTQWSLWKATLHCFLVLYLVLTCTMRILEFLWLVDRCFGKVNVGILSTIFNNVSLSTFLSPFFFFSQCHNSLYFSWNSEGEGKGATRVLQNDGKW